MLYFRKAEKNYSRAVKATAASVLAMLVAMPVASPKLAHAQDQTAQEQMADLESILVTGSRIVRDGFSAPTPVSVLSSEDLNAIVEPNIADAVNRLPALQGSLGTSNASTNVSSGTGGVNNLNLRALAAVRTLVLLDGKRIVGSSLAGFENNGSVPDINNFPGGLVERVDVVTGGASAVYGSDALAGVVNFVLDKDYTGIKGEVLGGVTTYGDNEEYKVSLTAGTPFANGRGHFLFFGEHNYQAGIDGDGGRPWNDPRNSRAFLANPAYAPGNGEPQYKIFNQVGIGNATAGGLIGSGPLAGTQFLEGGKSAPFNYGTRIGLFMVGGDYEQTNIWRWPTLNLETQRTNVFTRLSYDVTDNVNVYGEFSWGVTHARNESLVPNFRFSNNITIDNPFIPDNIRDQMTALGLASINVGTFLANGPRTPITNNFTGNTPVDIKADNERYLRRYVGGFEGNFDLMDTNWTWDAYYARSTTHNGTRSPDNVLPSKFVQAVNAVVDPNTGGTICRSTLTDPDDGCVPYNIFGTGVNGPLEWDYITGTGYAMTVLSQDVFAASMTGAPFEIWAGEVSTAFGVEHRIEKVRGIASDDDVNRRFFAGNYIPTNAKWSVTEGFFETVVPLARDEAWAESLEFNGAVRLADYSESGMEVTWKAGVTYTPMSEFTFRLTQSRDIRAPNLGDLFNEGRAGTGQVIDPFQGGKITADVVTADVGNPNLEPERADTTGVGLVYSPEWLPGFTASLDYYRIKIKGAISIVDDQDLIDGCFAGVAAFCSPIERAGGGNGSNVTGDIIYVAASPQNVLVQKTDGIDFEFAYNFPADMLMEGFRGDFAIRGLANYVFNLDTVDTDPVTGDVTLIEGAGIIPDGAGFGLGLGLATPHFRWNTSLTYSLDAFSGTVTWRGTGSGVYRNDLVVCQASCPTSVPGAITVNENSIGDVHYFDAALNYDILDGNATAFFVVKNLLNRDPPLIAANSQNGWYGGFDNDNFDRIGRTFRVGVRFSY